MKCRMGCAACCVVISISSPLPGLVQGKPAGLVCPHLEPDTLKCTIWHTPEYPPVCKNFAPDPNYCGSTRSQAMANLAELEEKTKPGFKPGNT